MNFAVPYQKMQRQLVAALREARNRGQTVYQMSHSMREVNPSRMSDAKIDMCALREAQRYTERVINIHNNG